MKSSTAVTLATLGVGIMATGVTTGCSGDLGASPTTRGSRFDRRTSGPEGSAGGANGQEGDVPSAGADGTATNTGEGIVDDGFVAPPPPRCEGLTKPYRTPLARLTELQYKNTLATLFAGLDVSVEGVRIKGPTRWSMDSILTKTNPYLTRPSGTGSPPLPRSRTRRWSV